MNVTTRTARPFPFNRNPSEPKEAVLTMWRNPTSQEQKVVVYEGDERVVYRIAPGGEKQIPQRHDRFIHRVQCDVEQCRSKGGFCLEGHPGVVHGGIAPQLVRVGPRPAGEADMLAKGLDTEIELKEEAEMAQVAAEERRRRAEIDAMLAQRRANEVAAAAGDGPQAGKRSGASAAK